MAALKRFFPNWWVLTLLATVLVALALTLGLPIFVGLLRPWWARLILLLIIFTVWGGFAIWRVLKARKASDELARELAKPEPGDAEAAALSQRMTEALRKLKAAAGDKRDYLYSRPWYVIIGPPGAGKTTALLNSGLRFPFSDASLKGVGGTRNLDFWFADEAALVDTAGRYTTQDSDAPADAKAWESFLKLLRKHRPLQPINGVLVAIGLDELLKADRATIDAHAAAVRRRLRELRTTLEVAAPVYVLFTKADLLAGFVEFYDDLDVEGRRAVLGATLPWGQGTDAGKLAAAYDGMAQAVADRTSVRLQEEPDARRRGLILGFAPQFEALRSRALRFLDGAFLAEGSAGLPLRGFYLTSGVQEGAPLDRILGGMAEVYEQPHTARSGGGRAYFLNRLLGDVVFPEAGLVQSDPKAAARRRTAFVGALAGIGAVTLLVLILWGVSFAQNRKLQGQLLAGAQNIQAETRATSLDLVEVRETDPDLEQALSILNRLRELPRGYAARKAGGAPLFSTFGLHQRSHSKEAEQAYLEGLQRILLPRILLRLERVLQENSADPLALYEPLKVYLMLGGHGPLDRSTVKAWVKADWENGAYPGADRAATRKALEAHLDALLDDPQLGRVWPQRRAPLDGGLIESARASVSTLSLADRAYVILRQKAASAGPPLSFSTVLSGGDARAFANGDAVLAQTVPYFFTRAGYEKSYLAGLQTAPIELKKELWVLGPEAETTAIQSQLASVRSGVAALYAQEYTKAWEDVVANLQPADYFRDPAAFGAFTRNPSPLKLVLLEVKKNTTFTGGAAGALAKKAAANPLGKAVMGAANPAGGVDAGKQIQDYFRPLHDYVGDGKAPGPVDEFVAAVKSAGSANAAAGVAGGGVGGAAAQGQLAMATGAVAAAAAGAPPMIQGFIASASEGGKAAATQSATGAIADVYAREILTACRGVVQDRYPFFGAAQNEVATADVLRVFGLNGRLDSFQSGSLASLIDTSGPVWRWRTDDPIAASLDPASAEQFQKAAEIRDLLAGGLPYQIEATGFGGAVTAVEFSAGGSTQKFEAGAMGAKPGMWSLTAGAPEARVVLLSNGKEVKRFEAEGAWALFRLMDQARKENSGPTAFKATFGEGAASATLRINLRTTRNPFGRGGAWSFRCPATL